MTRMLRYRTFLLAQTRICSRIPSMALRSIPPQCIPPQYTTFINKCIDNGVPTLTVRTYLNQKPCITGNICTELKARAATFKERDSNPEGYIKSRYAFRRTIKQAKQQYRTKIESHYTGSDAHRMWKGFQNHYRLQREAQPRAAQ